MFNILVVDDNSRIRKLITTYLLKDGYKVYEACDGEEAFSIIGDNHIDLMIVDVMMPKMDGYNLTKDLRNVGFNLPILMVTAKERIEDKKKGFDVGIDDYMVKPIDFEEMLMRITALLRRAKIASEKKIKIGNVILDYNTLTVIKEDYSILLPQKEFYLLFKLLSYPRKIFTRQDLMDEIWGFDTETDIRTVDVHIKRLREKFKDFNEFQIKTIRGLGYKVEKNI